MSHILFNGKDSEDSSLEEGRKPTGGDASSEKILNRRSHGPAMAKAPNPEAKFPERRRRFTAKYKLAILDAYDRCSTPEERGALLRREGIYTSNIAQWRRARKAGALGALAQKRGRPTTRTPQGQKIAQLEAENKRLQQRLDQAETIIEIQKKVSELLGIPIKTLGSNGEK